MSRISLLVLAIGLFALVIASGCVMPEVKVVNKVKQYPSVSSFLAQHPDAVLTFQRITEGQSRERMQEFVGKCGPNFSARDYYYVMFSEGTDSVEVLVQQQTEAIVCIHRTDDQCVYEGSCDDLDSCTVDICMGAPKECKYEAIEQCVTGDDCCPNQCNYTTDGDCPMPACLVDADCDDNDPTTLDTCITGWTNRCENVKQAIACIPDDNYCPPECTYAEDNDCEQPVECEVDADCDDDDPSTIDTCTGVPKKCTYSKITKCIAGDGICPANCDYATDTDCFAKPGSIERITVKCGDNETKVDAIIYETSDGNLKAKFDNFVTSKSNKSLLSYANKAYTYNDDDSSNINISERLSIVGTARYDKSINKSKLYIGPGGLSYILDLGEGIPATELAGNDKEFVAGSDDKIIIPLFTMEGLVSRIDQANGEVEILSNQTWLTARGSSILRNIDGKKGEDFTLRVARCDLGEAVFSLKKGDKIIARQTAGAGDILFPDYLKKTFRLNTCNHTAQQSCVITGIQLETNWRNSTMVRYSHLAQRATGKQNCSLKARS